MFIKKLKVAVMLPGLMLMAPVLVSAETIGIFVDPAAPQLKFAAGDIETALKEKNFAVEVLALSALTGTYPNKKVVLALASNSTVTDLLTGQGGAAPTGLGDQAYALRTTTQGAMSYWAIGGDVVGAMYGGFQLAENIGLNGFTGTYSSQEAPFMANRGIKLNMPLDRRVPTYVGNWTSRSTKKAIPHAWDMKFWKTLIDQQVRFRYNMLSVWVHHPFPALVQVADYPKACLPSIEGFDGFKRTDLTHEKRVEFFKEVMQYAHDRGMKFYFFNWNVYVDYAEDQGYGLTTSMGNAKTVDYFYKSMTALIETYPNLDGWGISNGDGMGGLAVDHAIKVSWSWRSMAKAVNDYLIKNPTRKFNLIQRGIGATPELIMKEYAPLIAQKNATVNYSVKYAQAHMYSTPTPKWTSLTDFGNGKLNTFLTIRNDSYFYINWGDHQFVRDYMNGVTNKAAVVGFYIGADGYTPAKTYLYKNPANNTMIDVERRWYMEMLWGRIGYNPNTNESVFKGMLAKRYPALNSENLFTAWTLASRPLPRATEIVMDENFDLDFKWWPEACWGDPARAGGFKTIDNFAASDVANGSNLCNIATSASKGCGSKKSSYMLADEMQKDAEKALELTGPWNGEGNSDLGIAVLNIKQMASLSMYYAHKVRGATQKKANELVPAKETMGKAYCWWMAYTRSMENLYLADSMRNVEIYPDWKFGDAAVMKEYTDLKGTGTPDCKDIIATAITSPTKGSGISIQSLTSKSIRFNLPNASVASISIFNSKGEVLLVQNGFAGKKGFNEFQFGKKIAQGLHLIQIKAGNLTATEKLKFTVME